MIIRRCSFLVFCVCKRLLFSQFVDAQREHGVRGSSSGGPLMPEQAAYDVKSYDLDLRSILTRKESKAH